MVKKKHKEHKSFPCSFVTGTDDSNMPSTEIKEDDLVDGIIKIMDLMVQCGITSSKSEARRVIMQGGLQVNDERFKTSITPFQESN